MLEKKKERIERKPLYALNGLRGIASLGVELFHMFLSHYHSSPILGFYHHGYLLVEFFYLVSGFILGYSYDYRKDTLTITEFLKRRFIKLEPMIIYSNFVQIVFFRYMNAPSINYVGLDKIPARNLLLLFILSILNIPTPPSMRYRPDPSMFTLYPAQWSLFWEYLANFCYIFILRYVTTLTLYILTAFSMIGSVVLIFYSKNGNLCDGFDVYNPYFAVIGIIRTFTPFLIGYTISRYKYEKENKSKSKSNKSNKSKRSAEGIKYAFEISSLILIIICSLPYLGEMNKSKWKNAVMEIIIINFILPLVLIIAINERKPSERKAYICQWLGRISFYLYFTHYIFTDFLLVWVSNNNYWFDYTWRMLIGIYIISLSLANFIGEVYDAPIQKWLSSVFLK